MTLETYIDMIRSISEDDARLAERMLTCTHHRACERMRDVAGMKIFVEIGRARDACVAEAYGCMGCEVWKGEDDQ